MIEILSDTITKHGRIGGVLFQEAVDVTTRTEVGVSLLEDTLVKMYEQPKEFNLKEFDWLYYYFEEDEVEYLKIVYSNVVGTVDPQLLPSVMFRNLSPQIAHFMDNRGNPDALEYGYNPILFFERAEDPCSVGTRLAWKIFEFSDIAREIRDRLEIVTNSIREKVKEANGSNIKILLIAGGLAPAVFNLAREFPNVTFQVDLVDINRNTLRHVSEIAAGHDNVSMNVHIGDATKENFERKGRVLEIVDNYYDVIEAVGINDYFPEQLMINLLNTANRKVKAGGRIIIGNMSLTDEGYSKKKFIERVLCWPDMEHKDREEIERIIINTLPNHKVRILQTSLSTVYVAVIDTANSK
jgi:hypothetical protein